MPQETKTPELVHCFVCGAGSHRDDWQDGKAHACDSHSAVEQAAARSKTAKAQAPPETLKASAAKD